MGLLLAVAVHTANIQDRDGAKPVLYLVAISFKATNMASEQRWTLLGAMVTRTRS